MPESTQYVMILATPKGAKTEYRVAPTTLSTLDFVAQRNIDTKKLRETFGGSDVFSTDEEARNHARGLRKSLAQAGVCSEITTLSITFIAFSSF